MQEGKQRKKNTRSRKAEKETQKRETPGKRTEQETRTPKTTKKQPLGQETETQENAQPFGRNQTKPKQNSRTDLDVALPAEVRIQRRDRGQLTQGATKTPGPPGTAGVFVAPAPETKRRKEKKKTNKIHILNSFLTATSRRVDATHSQGAERGNSSRKQERRRGQNLKGNFSSENHLHSQPRDKPETFIHNSPKTKQNS